MTDLFLVFLLFLYERKEMQTMFSIFHCNLLWRKVEKKITKQKKMSVLGFLISTGYWREREREKQIR